MNLRNSGWAVLTTVGVGMGACSANKGAGSSDAGGQDAPVSDAATVTDASVADGNSPHDGAPDKDSEGEDAMGDTSPPPGDSGVTFTVNAGAEVAVATYAQRVALGFRFGFVDGVLGALQAEGGAYDFFGSALTWNDAGSCPGTPDTQGAYRFGTSVASITTNFGCTALISDQKGGPPLTDGGAIGYFDRDYVGGGPVMRFTSNGQSGVLMTYHAEFHWGPTCPGGAPCFYGTLGMAVSTDDGQTFQSLGEIVQPAISRPALIAMGTIENSIGAGPFVLGDADGGPVDPANADPATTYLYVFFPDMDPAVTCGASSECLAVARALLSDVFSAALSHTAPVFSKFYSGGFTQPAWAGDPDDALPGGHYTPVLAVAGFSPTVLYDRTIGRFLLVTGEDANGQYAMAVRASSNLTSWPTATVATVNDANLEDRYPSLIGENPDTLVGGTAPYLFFTQVNPPGGPWSGATFMRTSLQIAVSP